MNKKIFILLILLILISLAACNNKPNISISPTPTSFSTLEPSPTISVTETAGHTPTPSKTEGSTPTPSKTEDPTPTPSKTEGPTPTPTPTPESKDYVLFSHKAGFYTKSFELKLTSRSNYVIYYTTDNSNPTTNSKKYTSPISITDRSSQFPTNDKTTVVRAAAFSGNLKIGPIYTYTYIVNGEASRFDDRYNNMPVISISTENSNLYDQNRGIFVNYTSRGREWERPCHIEFFESDGKLAFSQDAGIRVYGGTSRGNPLKSLKLYARKEYDEENGKFKFPIFPERKDTKGNIVDKYDTFVLRAAGNDNIFGGSRSTFLRDGLVHHLAGKIDKLDYMEYRPAIIYINGKYWGILNLRDVYDDDYIEQHYGLNKEKLAIISYGHEDGRWEYEIDEGTEVDQNDFVDMIQFITSFDMSNSSYYERVANRIDIDNFIKYMAVNIYANNRDWPHNNVKMWKYIGPKGSNYAEDGKWRFMLKDIDYAWGRYDESSGGAVSVMAEETNHNRDVLSGGGGDLGRVLGSLMRNKEFKTKFANFMCDLSNSYFSSATIQSKVISLQNLLSSEMKRQLTNKWDNHQPPMDYEQWSNNVYDLIQYGNIRPNVMRNTVREVLGLSNQVKVNIKVINSSYGVVKINTVELMNIDSWDGYYYSNTDVPLFVSAKSGYKVTSITVNSPFLYNNNKLSLKGSNEITVTVKFDKS